MKTLSDKQSQQVGTILRSGEHLLSLIHDILDLSKIEAGRITLKESGFTLKNLLTDVHQMFSLRAEEKRLKFTVEYDKNIPEFVSADEAKIRQILINIVGNALKFTDFGGIKINVQSRPSIAVTKVGSFRYSPLLLVRLKTIFSFNQKDLLDIPGNHLL